MQYFKLMESFHAGDCLDEDTPDLMFFEELFFLLMVNYFLVEVAVICELHDDAGLDSEYHKFLPSMKTYLYPMIFLFFRLAKMRTSFRAFSISFSERLASFTFLRA